MNPAPLEEGLYSTKESRVTSPSWRRFFNDLLKTVGGGVNSVGATAPIHSTGTTDPIISISNITNADISASAGIAESKLSLNYPTFSSANEPTADQKAALAGTDGTPSDTDRYVTDSDERLKERVKLITHSDNPYFLSLSDDVLLLDSSGGTLNTHFSFKPADYIGKKITLIKVSSDTNTLVCSQSFNPPANVVLPWTTGIPTSRIDFTLFPINAHVELISDGTYWRMTTLEKSGTNNYDFCSGVDARLSDARVPLLHQLDSLFVHSASNLTIGTFLKATANNGFGFVAHGLTYTDVGADANGAANIVQGNLANHANLTTTAHGGVVSSATTVNGQALSANVALTTANISDSANARYCTDAQKAVIANTSNTNTGDQTLDGLGGAHNTITINGHAISMNVALTLASADFANQGTTTTVLHGNANGNPAFGAVVEGDITLANNTTNNVSASKHGFVPIAPGDASKVLGGNAGTWVAVPCSATAALATTPVALGTAGSVGAAADIGHTHQSRGQLFSITTAVTVANTANETTILTGNLPANLLSSFAENIKLVMRGLYNCKANSGTLTLKFYLGANVANQTVVFANQAGAQTNVPWTLDVDYKMRDANNFICMPWGQCLTTTPQTFSTTAGGTTNLYSATSIQALSVTGTWASADANNSLVVSTCYFTHI